MIWRKTLGIVIIVGHASCRAIVVVVAITTHRSVLVGRSRLQQFRGCGCSGDLGRNERRRESRYQDDDNEQQTWLFD